MFPFISLSSLSFGSTHLRSREEAGQWWLERGSLGGPGSNYNLNTYPQFEPEVPPSLPRLYLALLQYPLLLLTHSAFFERALARGTCKRCADLPCPNVFPVLAPCQRDMGATAERRESQAVGMDEQALPRPLVQYC